MAFSPDGTLLASGSWDGRLCLWDIKTKSQVFQRDGLTGGIIAVLFSLDGKTIISTNQLDQIQLWNVNDNQQRPFVSLRGHTGWIRNIAFSDDGKTLASGSDDGTILLWNWEECMKINGMN